MVNKGKLKEVGPFLVEKCEPQAIEQVSTHSKITLKKSYLQIEHYNFHHGFTSCYYIKVTAELCVSLYPSASVGFAVELGNINSPLSLPLLPIVTNFPHSSNTWVLWLVESQTIKTRSCFSNWQGTRIVEFFILGAVFQIYKSFPEDQTF